MARKMGRPEVIQGEKLVLLKQAFAIGCTDEEACAYAKIPTSTFYEYQKRHPDFLEEKERLKKEPVLKAKHTVVKSLDDIQNAQWYLERKARDEFSKRVENLNASVDLTTLAEQLEQQVSKEYENYAAQQLATETKPKSLANDTSVQDQNESRPVDNVQAEPDTADAHIQEGQPQV